jgi:hypothetical protein
MIFFFFLNPQTRSIYVPGSIGLHQTRGTRKAMSSHPILMDWIRDPGETIESITSTLHARYWSGLPQSRDLKSICMQASRYWNFLGEHWAVLECRYHRPSRTFDALGKKKGGDRGH